MGMNRIRSTLKLKGMIELIRLNEAIPNHQHSEHHGIQKLAIKIYWVFSLILENLKIFRSIVGGANND